jgi:hypothetical protein
MDKDRQIRFLYPPLIFFTSIALGIWLDNSSAIKYSIQVFFKDANHTGLAVAILGLTSIVVVIGFLIGTLTVFFLRIIFFWNKSCFYELKLSKKALAQIGDLILKNKDDIITKKDRLYAGAVFDHSYIPENVHRWIARRWNAFLISSASILALILSLIIRGILNIKLTCGWGLTVLFFILVFLIQACYSWKESMHMIEFMIRVKKNDNKNISKSSETDD